MSTALAIAPPTDVAEWSERRLDNAIRRGHNACGRVMADYEKVATLTGVLLRERKRRLGPRKFAPWVEEHFDGGTTTAYRYLAMADERVPLSDPPMGQIEPPEVTPEGDEIVAEADIEIVEEEEASPFSAYDLLDAIDVEYRKLRAAQRREQDATAAISGHLRSLVDRGWSTRSINNKLGIRLDVRKLLAYVPNDHGAGDR
jgi:hypothetical protein